MKKTLIMLSFVFALIFALAIFNVSADEAATPVSNAAEFEAMVTGGNYYLTGDIDLGGKSYTNFIFAEFHGTIDGKGFTVKNFSIAGTDTNWNAMIGVADGFLNIKNLNIGTEAAPISVSGGQKASSGSAVLLGTGNMDYNCIFENVDIFANINITGNYKAMTAVFVAQGRNVIFDGCTANGTITVGSDTLYDQYRNAAGFMGSILSSTTTIFRNCVNNTDIILGASSGDSRAAGFLAYTDRAAVFYDCVNNGDMTVLDGSNGTASNSHIGGFIGTMNHYASYFTNCVNNGTLTGSKNVGTIIGISAGGAYLLGNTGATAGTNPIGLIQNNSFAYIEGDYTGYEDVATAEQFLAMQSGKKYRLTADIDLGGKVFDNFIFKEFSGVVDGQGHKVYNFSLKDTDKTTDLGIFTITIARIPFVLKDIQFGTADQHIVVDGKPTAGKSQAVVLSGVHSNGTAWLKDINAYADFTTSGIGQKYCAGGIVAYGRHMVVDGCNYYGKFTVGDFETNKNETVWKNTAAVVGAIQQTAYVFNSNNYAEVVLGNGSGEVRSAGIVGYVAYPCVIANCNNYGKISVITNDTTQTSSNAHAAGVVVEVNNAGTVVYNCANYGEVVSDDKVEVPFVGGIISRVRNSEVVIIDCKNMIVPVGKNANELAGVVDNNSYPGTVKVINFTDAANQPVVTPPDTGDMSIVFVAAVAMISLVGAALIVCKKRSFSK